MRSVAIAIFPGVQALDVAGPIDVFSEANGFLAPGDHYAVTLLAATRSALRASNGMTLVPDATFDAAFDPTFDAMPDAAPDESARTFDLALVAGGPALPDAPPDPPLTAWLTGVASHCERYGSICTGAFALGHAGLLDERHVTTHWQHAQQLADRFPRARVDFDRIYLRDDRLVTSAGVTAGIDLALSLVAEDHGARTALAVAKRLVVFAQRQGGQSQFSPYLTAPADDTSPIAKVQAHVMANIRGAFTVRQLADVAGMSARHFARVFVQETHVTPHEFVERARLDAARQMLESGDAPLKAVAWESGFGHADRMRTVFAKRLGVTPQQYRERFRREADRHAPS
ncbi:GlxA family transcriptional regulator [Burkholderia guangdongensis]|uniref:GlxA family transcriptional regulator n=1 Tax=Burkholderia guangdongensis TaxID=1792500 RepID=UPI0015C7D276|nr:helix-turn-helix domain-containing protein [Burkholderia guangdongensis]